MMQVKKLRSIIIDDSAFQRMAISKLINNHPDLDLIVEYKDGYEATCHEKRRYRHL